MAKDLVRTRRYVRKFVLMRANIQAVSLKIQTLKSNNSMAQAMKGVTKAMGTMNRQVGLPGPLPAPYCRTTLTLPPLQLKLPQIQKIMMEFERQAEIMDMKEEMMNDAIDDAMGDEDDEEERFADPRWEGTVEAWPSQGTDPDFSSPSDAVVSQVLDELGLSLTDELSSECFQPWALTPPHPPLGIAAHRAPTPSPCRPPLHRRLPQCGCWWEESRGRGLRPGGCGCRPGGTAQEPAEGLSPLGPQGHSHCTLSAIKAIGH